MIPQYVLVGSLVIVLCMMLFVRHRWFLENSSKGQRLIRWFGPEMAPWVLRILAALGMIFGGLLATGIIRPIQW